MPDTTRLGHLIVTDTDGAIEIRKKIRKLVDSLSFSEIQATRIETIVYEVCRRGCHNGRQLDMEISLQLFRSKPALIMDFKSPEQLETIPSLGNFFDNLAVAKMDGGMTIVRTTKLLPKSSHAPAPALLEELQVLLASLSKNGLTEMLKGKNQELETRAREMLVVMHDLDEARKQAETASKAKSAFLASMSHELRTPLNAILGFSQIMAKDRTATESQKENLAIIIKSGEHLFALINSVLDLAKIEAGKVKVESTEFDLANLILDLITMLRGHAEAKGLRLFLDQSSSFPRFIRSDPAKLRQILINLIGNAIKFTEEGEVNVKLAVLTREQGAKDLELAFDIRDTGPGMAQTDIERIFRPFEQARQKGLNEGTGLGLAIAREFITMLGGSISATAELGKGSNFHFTIVGKKVADNHIPQTQQSWGDIVTIDNAPSYKILVIDDQADNRLLLKQLLSPYGFQYREASNGGEGVVISRQWQPHCILMDRRMPVMDGIEATRTIRDLNLLPRPVIIAVTAHAYKEERAEMFAAGCDDFLGKPFKDDHLFATLAKHLPITIARTPPHPDSARGADLPIDIDATDFASTLSNLSAEVLVQLQQAFIRCDINRINDILRPHPEATMALKPLLETFRFDFLIEEMDRQLQDTS